MSVSTEVILEGGSDLGYDDDPYFSVDFPVHYLNFAISNGSRVGKFLYFKVKQAEGSVIIGNEKGGVFFSNNAGEKMEPPYYAFSVSILTTLSALTTRTTFSIQIRNRIGFCIKYGNYVLAHPGVKFS